MDIICIYLNRYRCIRIAKCIYRYSPCTASVISFRQLASLGFCQTKLNTHRFVHPIICCKFGSISSNRFFTCVSIRIILPLYRLHICSQISIIAPEIYTKEISKCTAVLYTTDLVAIVICTIYQFIQICDRLQLLTFNTGICTCLTSAEGKTSICILCRCLQTICILCYFSSCCITFQVELTITAGKRSTIFHNFIFRFKCFIITGLYFYRNIFDTGNFVIIHFFGCIIRKSDCTSRKSNGSPICQDNIFSIFGPVIHLIRISICIIDGHILLIISSVKTMICCSSCHGIKSTFISFPFDINFCR